MKRIEILAGAIALVLASPLAAKAAKLTLAGRVEMTSAGSPIADARVTVTFHGHEMGIHEYTTERQVRVRTDELGQFVAEVKVPDDRYLWTHADIAIEETELSKAMVTRSICRIDGNGGGSCDKTFRVSPLVNRIAAD